jgi:hypothetical protein
MCGAAGIGCFPRAVTSIPTGCGYQRLSGVAVGRPQTPQRPKFLAQSLVGAVGTYVQAEFGSCVDAQLAVDAR